MKLCSIILIFCALFPRGSFCQNLDLDLLRDINANRAKSADKYFSVIAGTAYPFAVLTPITEFTIGHFAKNSQLKEEALIHIAGSAITTVCVIGLKYSISRTRPFDTHSFVNPYYEPNSPSFPSSHTSIAFAWATTMSMQHHKWYVIAPVYLYAGTVAYSRVYMGVHYPSDVLAGAIVGTASAWVAQKGAQWINKRNEKRGVAETNLAPALPTTE